MLQLPIVEGEFVDRIQIPPTKGVKQLLIQKGLLPPSIKAIPIRFIIPQAILMEHKGVFTITKNPNFRIEIFPIMYNGERYIAVVSLYKNRKISISPTEAVIEYDETLPKELRLVKGIILGDKNGEVDAKKVIKLSNQTSFSGWKILPKEEPLTPVRSGEYTLKGNLEDYGNSVTLYLVPRMGMFSQEVVDMFRKFANVNGMEIQEDKGRMYLYNPELDKKYVVVSPHLNLLEMLARFGVVLLPATDV